MARHLRMLAVISSRIKKRGSFEDYIVAFAHKAKERGWDLGFAFPGIGAPDVVELIEQQGASIHVPSAPWSSPAGRRELIRLIREFKPDIVNFHFCDTLDYLPVFLYCRAAGISVAYHYHGEIRPLHTLNWKNRHLSALRLLSLFWNRVITVSYANQRFLEALHVATPIDVVYNGIDVDGFLERSAELDSHPCAEKRDDIVECLYMGSLIDRKRIDILLRAFALVRERFPGVRLTLVGGGNMELAYKKLATELQLDDVARFTGLLIDYPFELLKCSDLFVSASESESFGLVFAEAMCFALPVVACRVGGIPEVVSDGKTGLLAEANDPADFATAMLTLLEDSDLRKRMGEAGRQKVQGAFRLDDTIEATFQAFGRVS